MAKIHPSIQLWMSHLMRMISGFLNFFLIRRVFLNFGWAMFRATFFFERKFLV